MDNSTATLLGLAGIGVAAYLIISNQQKGVTVTVAAPVGTTSAQGASDGTTSLVQPTVTQSSVTQTQATGNTIPAGLQLAIMKSNPVNLSAAAAAMGMTVPQYQQWLQIQVMKMMRPQPATLAGGTAMYPTFNQAFTAQVLAVRNQGMLT